MIQAEGLTKMYGERRAIDGLTFHAEKGEIVGFLGPNGAGKTTTMRILTGYMPPTEGKARVAGYDLLAQSLEVRRRVGYLPETVPLYTDMTVRQYLEFMAEIRGVKNREDRATDAIERVHLEDRAESYIANLSKGMRQRVGLAQALIHDPEVLILDEPTIGLDPAQIIEVRNLIRELGRDRTVMLSTHILSEAQHLCNRVLIINRGKFVAEDSPERLQARLAGGNRVLLRLAGDGDGAAKLVGNVPGVVSVHTVSDGELEIETSPGRDARPDVARAVVNAGYQLLELRSMGMSLEDIYLELTRDDQLATADAQEAAYA